MTEVIDMSRFVEAKSDQLNADDLIGAPRTITITRVTGSDGDQPVSIHYQNDSGKPFKPCKTMRRVLLAVWGRNAVEYVGRSMTVYRDDGVTFGGLNVGGIRISHMSHIDKKTVVVVMKSKGKKAGIEVLPLVQSNEPTAAQLADFTAKFIANVNKASSIDALHAFAAKQADRLDKLPPELRAQTDKAVADRLAVFQPTEGKPDDDFGEAFADDFAA